MCSSVDGYNVLEEPAAFIFLFQKNMLPPSSSTLNKEAAGSSETVVTPTKLQSDINLKITILIFTAVKTSDLIFYLPVSYLKT
jgi:hypothetical protein